MEERCKLCGRSRSPGSDYCLYHGRAHENLVEAFSRWKRALDIDWRGFLAEVRMNPETGDWAREVAGSLEDGSR